MTNMAAWVAAIATVAILMAYEAALALAHQHKPERLARTAHAALREEWFDAVSAQKGSEILAVQTLRNSLMSATMTASTAVLGLMGTVTLVAPSLRATFSDAPGTSGFTARLTLELALMALLFASLASSVMAVRYYNHAGFIAAMPVGSEARRGWSDAGRLYVRRAGILYSWGLRHLILVAPILASVVHPAAGPVAALGVVVVLVSFDRFQNKEGRDIGSLGRKPVRREDSSKGCVQANQSGMPNVCMEQDRAAGRQRYRSVVGAPPRDRSLQH